MRAGRGQVKEIYLGGMGVARIACPVELIPKHGQYLLAHAQGEAEAALPHPIFTAGPANDGFLAAAPLPADWRPGVHLNLRGPLGNGFELPGPAHRIALVAYHQAPARLLALLPTALDQQAAVTLVCDDPPEDLPHALEIVPINSLAEAAAWADFVAVDLAREDLAAFTPLARQARLRAEAQVLVRTPLTCGGLADCAACAVTVRRGYRLACKEGPVFDLKDVLDLGM